VRGRLLALPRGEAIIYQTAYKLTRDIPNKPVNWQANVRDELHRLWHRGYFTQAADGAGTVYVRTDKREDDNGP
jgi:hypothetical protein